MTAAVWLRNIGAFATQAAVLVAAAVAIWRLTRIRHGAVSHAFWRLLLVVCLLLPIAQPWHVPEPPRLELAPEAADRASAPPESGDVKTGDIATATMATPSASEWLLLALLGGIAARALWLAVGALSLRRLRRTATPLDPPPAGIRDAFARVGVQAAVCVSSRVAGPITFGFRRPLVLVPPRVLAMDDALQEAIVCHELMHVRRHDWLVVIGEELVRTIFWFHPVIWWLINRIQLSREHVVDEAVVVLTRSRERYVEAMLAVALSRSPFAFAPAPQFLRRRSLKRRVAHILQETTMTTRRLVASVAAAAGILTATGVLVVRAFPLEARAPQPVAPQSVDAGAPVTIVRGADHMLHGALPEYPPRALAQRVEGEVALEITVDDHGEVSDARVVSGPDELRRAALESVLQWHYLAAKVSSTTLPVALRFNASAIQEKEEKNRAIGTPGKRLDIVLMKEGEDSRRYAIAYKAAGQRELTPPELELELTDRPRAREGGRARTALPQQLVGIRTERVSTEVVKEILDRAGVGVGTTIDSETTLKQIREAVEAFDPHLHLRFEPGAKGGLVIVVIAP